MDVEDDELSDLLLYLVCVSIQSRSRYRHICFVVVLYMWYVELCDSDAFWAMAVSPLPETFYKRMFRVSAGSIIHLKNLV